MSRLAHLVPTVGSRLLLLAVLIGTTMGCDTATKHVAHSTLFGVEPISLLGDVVRLQYAENTGGFLSLGAGLSPELRWVIFTGATGLGLVAMAMMAVFTRQRWLAVAGLGLVVAGGLSNWVDRLPDGRVIDFMVIGIGSIRTGVFNVADVAIMVGAGLMLLAHSRVEPDAEPTDAEPARD